MDFIGSKMGLEPLLCMPSKEEGVALVIHVYPPSTYFLYVHSFVYLVRASLFQTFVINLTMILI